MNVLIRLSKNFFIFIIIFYYFTKELVAKGFSHRHSRVRTPSDNGHLERFNRTIQKEIPEYLKWYNEQRPHMALEMKSPLEVLRSY